MISLHAGGVRAFLPIMDIPPAHIEPQSPYRNDRDKTLRRRLAYFSNADEYSLAILPCKSRQSNTMLVCLILRRSAVSCNPTYEVGATFSDGSFARVLLLDPSHPRSWSFLSSSGRLSFGWREVYISQRYDIDHDASGVHMARPLPAPCSLGHYQVCIPQWLIAPSTPLLGPFRPCPTGSHDEFHVPRDITPDDRSTYTFAHVDADERFHVHVGLRQNSSGAWGLVPDVEFVPSTAAVVDLPAVTSADFSFPELPNTREYRACTRNERHDGRAAPPYRRLTGATVDQAGSRWENVHTFESAERTWKVIVRTKRMISTRADPGRCRELWAMGVEVAKNATGDGNATAPLIIASARTRARMMPVALRSKKSEPCECHADFRSSGTDV